MNLRKLSFWTLSIPTAHSQFAFYTWTVCVALAGWLAEGGEKKRPVCMMMNEICIIGWNIMQIQESESDVDMRINKSEPWSKFTSHCVVANWANSACDDEKSTNRFWWDAWSIINETMSNHLTLFPITNYHSTDMQFAEEAYKSRDVHYIHHKMELSFFASVVLDSGKCIPRQFTKAKKKSE